MSIVRHCGVVRSTGSRVFVIFRQLEDDPQHCLVVYRDALPEVYASRVSELVLGNKGQSSIELWDVMDKVGILDGSNMLNRLHSHGYMRKQNTGDIDIHVGGNNKIPLNILNDEINQSSSVSDGTVKDYNPYDKPTEVNYPEQGSIVSRLLAEADQYEQLAFENRERAYNLDPTLRPSVHEAAPAVSDGSLFIELPEGISQSKAIELVKKAIKGRKGE